MKGWALIPQGAVEARLPISRGPGGVGGHVWDRVDSGPGAIAVGPDSVHF